MPPRTAPKPTMRATGGTSKQRHKPTQKKVVPPAERLKRLFKSLCAQIDGGHFKNAVKTCDKILRIDPTDEDALQAKLFLLLQTEQYTAALTILGGLGDSDAHSYEKAYTLYRLQRESDAAELLPQLKASEGFAGLSHGIAHLEAQICYRQNEYQEAFDLYTQLLDSSSLASDEHADLLTNLNAAQAHLDFLTTGYLHALDALPASVINTLERNPPPAPPGTTLATNATVNVASASSEAIPAKPIEKKVRLSRVPKGVVPGVTPPPDPERWIKKSERTNIGHTAGKRRKAAGGGATQGSLAEPVSGHATKSSGAKHRKKK